MNESQPTFPGFEYVLEHQPIEKRGPYDVLERSTIHDKYSMQLVRDRIRNPDGSNGDYYWINFSPESVLVFPIDDKGNIYLSEEYTYATARFMTEVAGGSAKEGETFEEAAKRKVKEEIGLDTDHIKFLGTLYQISSRVNNPSHLFFAKVKSVSEINPEIQKTIRLKKVPFDDAVEMCLDGRICTGSIVAGILQIKLLLDSQKLFDNPDV